MRLLICGDRNWANKDLIREYIYEYHHSYSIECIIEGEAKGADQIAGQVAIELGLPLIKFPAKWHQFGRSAGPRRNIQMLVEGKPTNILAFHDNINQSKGTYHMLNIGVKSGITCELVTHKEKIIYLG